MKRIPILMLFLLACVFIANAQRVESSLIVKGESKIFQKPDIMEISINVSTKAIAYQSCVDENFSKVNRLKQSLKAATIESLVLKDIGQQVREERTYSSGRSVPDGFRATYTLKVKISALPKIIHECLNVLKSTSVDMNYNANYGLSPKLMNSLEEKLIKQAVIDAITKAKILTTASETQLGKIKNITYGVVKSMDGHKQFMLESSIAKRGQSGDQSFLDPDDIVLTDQVEISYWLVQN